MFKYSKHAKGTTPTFCASVRCMAACGQRRIIVHACMDKIHCRSWPCVKESVLPAILWQNHRLQLFRHRVTASSYSPLCLCRDLRDVQRSTSCSCSPFLPADNPRMHTVLSTRCSFLVSHGSARVPRWTVLRQFAQPSTRASLRWGPTSTRATGSLSSWTLCRQQRAAGGRLASLRNGHPTTVYYRYTYILLKHFNTQ